MKKKIIAGTLCLVLITGCGAGVNSTAPDDTSVAADVKDSAVTEEARPENDKSAAAEAGFDGNLHMEDGMAQPMLEYSSARTEDYSNEDSDILRFCVYVETDHDTDSDGMNDLVKAFVQVPRGAAEGNFKAGTIYDSTPYSAGTVTDNSESAEKVYYEEAFDYDTLYKEGQSRDPAGEMTTLEAAADADSQEWNYDVPNGTDSFSKG